MQEEMEYFFVALEYYIKQGKSPDEALSQVVNDYAYVFCTDDGRRPFVRAAELALKQSKEKDQNGK